MTNRQLATVVWVTLFCHFFVITCSGLMTPGTQAVPPITPTMLSIPTAITSPQVSPVLSPSSAATINSSPPQATSPPTPDTPAASPLPSSGPTPSIKSGVKGQVELGPVCGNPAQLNQVNCSNQPYEAQFTITDLNGQIIIREKTETDGSFSIPLPPGEYILVPEVKGPLSSSPVQFKVNPDTFTDLLVLYHTNIP